MTSPQAPWLSILLPVYNVAPYVEACVESILRQADTGIEVLLMDDASSDGSAAVLARLQERHGDRIAVQANGANLGVSATRNRLLELARGDYVWFLDADDLLCEGAIDGLRRTVVGGPDLVMCDYRYVRDRFALKHRLRGEAHRSTFTGPACVLRDDRGQLVEGVFARGQMHVWSKIARREAWRQVRFPEGRHFEDIVASAALLLAARSWIHVPEPWVGYRQRPGSIMKSLCPAKILDLNRALLDIHAMIGRDPALADGARFAFAHFCLRTYASTARRLARGLGAGDTRVTDACRVGMRELFPDGGREVLAGYRRRGWLAREWRARRSLRRMGWLG